MDCLILQDYREVEFYHSGFINEGRNLQLFAWTPSAVDALQKIGIDYICAGDVNNNYFDYKEREILIKQYGEWACCIDEIIKEEIPDFAYNNIIPFQHHFAHYRNIYMMYIMEIDILYKLKSMVNPKKIYYFKYNDNEFSPISRVTKIIEYSKKWEIEFIALLPNWKLLETEKEQHIKTNYNPQLDLASHNLFNIGITWSKSVLKQKIFGKKAINNIISLVSGLSFGRFNRKGTNVLVFVSNEQETNPILSALKAKVRNINYIFWEELLPNFIPEINFDPKRILELIKENKKIKELSSYKEINFFSNVYHEIENIVNEDIIRFYRNVVYFKILNDRLKFKLVISAYNFALLEAIYNQCEQMSIPLVITPHGGTVGIFYGAPFQYEYIRKGGDFFYSFVYTKAIKDFQENVFFNTKNKVNFISVGSSYFKTLYQQRGKFSIRTKQLRMNICFVLGMFVKVADNNIGILRESCMYELLIKTLNQAKINDQVKITIKCGYGFEDYDLDIFKNFPECKFVSSATKLTDIMWDMDVFLLPSLSSSFFELACTNTPILMLVDPRVFAVDEKAMKLIKKRACVVQKKEEFLERTKDLFIYNRQSSVIKDADPYNDDYFYSYCWDGEKDPAEYGAQWIKDNLLIK